MFWNANLGFIDVWGVCLRDGCYLFVAMFSIKNIKYAALTGEDELLMQSAYENGVFLLEIIMGDSGDVDFGSKKGRRV